MWVSGDINKIVKKPSAVIWPTRPLLLSSPAVLFCAKNMDSADRLHHLLASVTLQGEGGDPRSVE